MPKEADIDTIQDWRMKIWVDTTWLVEIPRYVYTCKVETVGTVARKKTENCHKMLITKLSGRIHSTIPYKVIVLKTLNLIPHNITYTHLFGSSCLTIMDMVTHMQK